MRCPVLIVSSLIFMSQVNAESVSDASFLFQAEDYPRSQWPLEHIERDYQTIAPSPRVIEQRLLAQKISPDLVDPITLMVNKKNAKALLGQLGIKQYTRGTAENKTLMEEKMENELFPRIKNGKFEIKHSDLSWISLEKLSELLKTPTVRARLNFAQLDQISLDQSDFYLQGYFGDDWESVWETVSTAVTQKWEQLPLEKILPEHLRLLYGKYSSVRGRNCFATALEFAHPFSYRNPTINVKREEDHSEIMINSDEFWSALWRGYYVLNDDSIKSGLIWGDIVVFYEKKDGFIYQSLKHAAVHLGEDVYFHKQSKSPASPLEIVDWSMLTSVWEPLTKELGYRFFRRLPLGRSQYLPSKAANEKISWTR